VLKFKRKFRHQRVKGAKIYNYIGLILNSNNKTKPSGILLNQEQVGKLSMKVCMYSIHTYTHIHSINPVSARNLQLDIEHVNKLDNTKHI
jgi:hypothetical protein